MESLIFQWLHTYMSKRMQGVTSDEIILVTRRGQWAVGVDDKCGDGSLFLVDGWSRFAMAHELQKGDFVTFYYQGDYTFSVIIFDVSRRWNPLSIKKPKKGKISYSSGCENEFLNTESDDVGKNSGK